MNDRPMDEFSEGSGDDGSFPPADAGEAGDFASPAEFQEGQWPEETGAADAVVDANDQFAEEPVEGADSRIADDSTTLLAAPEGQADAMTVKMRWDAYASAHHIGIELKHLEDEVRDLLEPIDQRRKRKFSGTRRWHELEDDLRALRFSGRLPETTIAKILQLIAKRHTLYQRLSFLSATRPTWNT